jgi:hypothetical protein
MLNVIMQSVIMVSGVAPQNGKKLYQFVQFHLQFEIETETAKL